MNKYLILLDLKKPPIDECEMEVTNEHAEIITSIPSASPDGTPSNPPKFFEHLTSFQPNQWQNSTTQQQAQFDHAIDWSNNQERLPPKPSPPNQKQNQKPSTSFFQMAKNFCENMMKKPKSTGNIELGLDEITNRMALLRFSSILDMSVGFWRNKKYFLILIAKLNAFV